MQVLLQVVGHKALLIKDIEGLTPLHAAAAKGHYKCISIANSVLSKQEMQSYDNLHRLFILII